MASAPLVLAKMPPEYRAGAVVFTEEEAAGLLYIGFVNFKSFDLPYSVSRE
jgi:hypothetical protein